jgi:hypothetical protein
MAMMTAMIHRRKFMPPVYPSLIKDMPVDL